MALYYTAVALEISENVTDRETEKQTNREQKFQLLRPL